MSPKLTLIFLILFVFFSFGSICSATVLYSNGVDEPDRVYGLSFPFSPVSSWRTADSFSIYLHFAAGHDCDVYFAVMQGASTLDCTSVGGAGGHKLISQWGGVSTGYGALVNLDLEGTQCDFASGTSYSLVSKYAVACGAYTTNAGGYDADGIWARIYDDFGDSEPYLSIDVPGEDSFLIAGDDQTFSGRCKNVGASKLILTDTWPRYWELDSSDFNLTCSSDYAWTSSSTLDSGFQNYYIFDVDVLTNAVAWGSNVASVSFNAGSTSSLEYSLYITDPDATQGNAYVVKPCDSCAFRFQYTVPGNSESSTEFILATTNENYDTVVSILVDNNLNILDTYGNGYVDTSVIVATTTGANYYLAILKNSNDDIVEMLRFSVYGDVNSYQEAVLASDKDLGVLGNSLRYLFVPPEGQLRYEFNQFYEILKQAMPFSFYYQVVDYIPTSSNSSTVSLSVDILISGLGTTSLDVLNFDDDSPQRSFADLLRPFITAGLWIVFILYIVNRIWGSNESDISKL